MFRRCLSNGDSDLFSEESSLLTPSDPALFGPFMTRGGEGQICPPDQIGLMSNFLMWPLFGPTMYILSCFAILALLFRISNLVLPRVRRNATAVLLNGVKCNKSLFIYFLQNVRKRSRLDVSGATSTTIAEPYLRIIKTSSSAEEMVGF